MNFCLFCTYYMCYFCRLKVVPVLFCKLFPSLLFWSFFSTFRSFIGPYSSYLTVGLLWKNHCYTMTGSSSNKVIIIKYTSVIFSTTGGLYIKKSVQTISWWPDNCQYLLEDNITFLMLREQILLSWWMIEILHATLLTINNIILNKSTLFPPPQCFL